MYLEYLSGVEQLGIYFIGGEVPPTDYEYLCALETGGLWLCGAHVSEQLLTDPQEGRVVPGPEHLRHEPSVLSEEVARQA